MKTKITQIVIVGAIFTIVSYSFSSNNNLGVMKMQCEVAGSGTPIVLVPGGLTGWSSWEPFVKLFSNTRTVIRVQLLGVQLGLENRQLPEYYSVKTESEALAATLDSLGYTMPVDVVAWSYGAFTSLEFALDHPDRIRTLTLIEPPALWVLKATGKWDKEAQSTANFMQTFHGEISEAMLADFLVHAGFVQPGHSARDLPQWNTWIPYRRSLRMNPFIISNNDVQKLRNFKVPTLLVKGTGSTTWLHNIIEGLSETIPNAHVIELPGGHAPHLVSNERFLAELDKFQSNRSSID